MRFGGLIAAVVFAAIAAVVVLRMSGSSAPTPTAAPAPEAKSVNVYVATKPLSVGTTIAETDIGVQPWPENLMLDGFIQADGKTNLIGMVTRAPMQQSEPVTLAKVANPNDPNFLAGDLPKGMRVVTIPVNETDGVAGFVFPGDHVDVIFTHDVDKWVTPPATLSVNTSAGGSASQSATATPVNTKITVTETLLTNVKVAAIDQRSSGAGAVDAKGALIIPRSATLIVSQADAQRVRLAAKTGVLSFALRALADKETADPLILTGPGDVSQSKNGLEDAGKTEESSEIKIVRGAPTKDKEFEAGGAATTRGATGATGNVAVPNNQPIPAPAGGGNVITPGLAAF